MAYPQLIPFTLPASMWGLGPTEAVSGFAEGIKHGVKSGYYECLANCMFADKGHLLPPAIAVGFERFMEHLIEHGGADWIARSIYKAPTLEQWNYYSKIVVPRASYTLKLAGRALGAAGLGVFIYETYTCTRKCMKCL